MNSKTATHVLLSKALEMGPPPAGNLAVPVFKHARINVQDLVLLPLYGGWPALPEWGFHPLELMTSLGRMPSAIRIRLRRILVLGVGGASFNANCSGIGSVARDAQ